MQTQERNSLADSLNSIKIDLKLIALGGKKNAVNTDCCSRSNCRKTVQTSPKK